MKVVITGAKGMLGQALQKELQRHQVLAADADMMNITDLKQVRRVLTDFRPEVVINCAAYTDVDACESHTDTAYSVNARGAGNLAVVCNELGSAMVQISTDYVFNGSTTGAYEEFAPVGPLGIYGKSKLAGEELVKSLCPRHYIVRTSWLFGPGGKNFVQTMLKLASERDVLTVVDDQRGRPTYTRDLAQAIESLIQSGLYGVYHVTNSGECSWYQFAVDIMEQAGISKVELRPVTSQEFKRPAPRPANSVLGNRFWRIAGFPELRDYRQALQDYLDTMGKSEIQKGKGEA